MLTIKNRFIQLLKGKKAFMLIFAFIMATFTTGVLTLNLHYAKAETNVNSISITINEYMGTSGTVVQNDVGLTQRDFQVTRMSASGGVGSYQVRLLNSDYIFADSGLTVTANGAVCEFTYDTDNPSRFIWFNYTASTNFIELYDGENLISSTINLGTVDKKDLATTTKTITILNPDPNPEQAGNPMAGPQTRTLGLSFSPKSNGGSGAGGSGSGGGDSGSGSGSGSSVMAFGTNPTSLSTITTGSSATFSIYLNTSLGAGTYTMTLRINSTQKDGFDGYPIDVTYDVTVTVTDTVGEQYSVAIYDGANKLTNGTVIDFGTVDKSELGTVASRTFTIKNEGTQGYSDFEISTYTNVFLINNDVFISTSLGVNGSYNITLTVGTGTNAGEYQSYLNFGDKDHVVSGNLILRLKVTEQTSYLLEAYNGETLYNSNSMYNFGQAAVGSNVPAEHIFRIVNAGANATGDLSVSLQYTKMAADAFTVVNSIPSIAKNGEYNLSIQPKENLSAGEYQATVNIYNSNVSVSFKIGFTVFALTEVTSIVIPAGKLVAPAVDATISTQNGSGTGYNYNVRYQEYSGGDWVTPTSSKFMAGKTYRIIVTATKQQNSTFASNVTMMLGEDAGENITATAYQVIGYKTFAKLPAASYSLEVVGADQHYNSGTLTYTFDNLVDEYGVVTPGYLTLNNLGSNATGDFNVSFIIPNSGAEGYAYESTSYIPSIASGNSYIFEIKPAIGLAPSTYAENLTISNANISITLHIILTVDKKPYKMQVNYDHIELNFATGNTNKIEYILIGGDTATFGFDYLYNDLNSQSTSFEREHENLKVGYSATDANRFETQIRIKNKGVNQLTNIEITRSGPGNEYFTISEDDFTSLNSNASDSFYIKPRTGAPAGTHKTTVVITADNVDPIIITFSFTVNKVITQIDISGLTLPEGGDQAPRNLIVETEGVYIRLMGWSKVSGTWTNKYTFTAGEQYTLNLLLNTKTGYIFNSTWNTYYHSQTINFDLNFLGTDYEPNPNISYATYAENSCRCEVTFTALPVRVKGWANIEIYDYDEAYMLNAKYGVQGLDQGNYLRFKWYKDGVALNAEPSLYSYYQLNKTDVTSNSQYYVEISHINREGSLNSDNVLIGPTTRVKPASNVIQTTSPMGVGSCTQKGSISWNRNGLEYRIASAYDDIGDTFTDWQDAPTQENVGGGGGTTAGGGVTTGGGEGGGGAGGSTVTYYGHFDNVEGGTIYWFRFKATNTLNASDIAVFNIAKGNHTLTHVDEVVPDINEICTVNRVQEHYYCSVCHKYFDLDGNEFDSVEHLTTHATGHKDENGDLFCDYCGMSIMNRYFLRVESLDDITAGAKYIIVNNDGQVMELVKALSENGGKYVNALDVERNQSDIANDWYASSDIDKINAFVFQIGTLPSKSTDVKTCYSFYIGNACIDFENGLILSPKSWNDRNGFSITASENNTFIITSWDGSKELSQAKLQAGGNVFALNAGNKLLSINNKVRLYKVVSKATTLEGNNCEVNEKKTETDYTKMNGDYTKEGNKSLVSGVIDAISEDYIKSFAKKKGISENNAEFDIKSSVEVTEHTANTVTMDVHPTISCGDKSEIISDRNLNGQEMTLTLFVGTTVPEFVTHRLTTGGVEYFYKEAKEAEQKQFTYEIDTDGNVYVTFTVTQFSIFVITMPVPEALTGTVNIMGGTEVGDVLSVEIKDSNIDMSSVVYTWLRDGVEISGATGDTYTLTNADKNTKISVRVTDNVHTESLTSAETDTVTEKTITIGKTDCTNCCSNDGVITGVDTTMEFSSNGESWVSITKTTITNLAPGTYYVRIKGTDTSTQVTINVGPHTFGAWQAGVPATCKNTGTVAHKECLHCHKNFDNNNVEINDVIIPITEHMYKDWVVTKSATCTESGNRQHQCEICGEIEYETIPALGHDYQFSGIVWTNFTAKAVFVCSHDNLHTEEYDCVVVSEITQVPTCTTQGVKTYTATYLTYSDTKEEVLAKDSNNHNIVHHAAQAPTCTEHGWEAYDTCTRCGYTTYQEIDALGHDYGDWVTTTQAQPGVKGEQTRTCSRCGHTQTKAIPALPFVNEDGYMEYNEIIEQNEQNDLTEIFAEANEQNGVVSVTLDEFRVSFDVNAVSQIADNTTASLFMTIETENITDIGIDNVKLVLDISLGGVEFNEGKATIEIPFVQTVPEGKVAKVYYVDASGNKTDMNATFINGKACFETTHFSRYVVVFEDTATPSEAGGMSMIVIIGVVAGVVVLGLCVYLFIIRKKSIE